MKVIEIPIEQLHQAPWNPNKMPFKMMAKLRESIRRYGIVQNLVVRPDGVSSYEVLSGNQRLFVLQELGVKTVSCVVVDVDEANARLLADALNQLHGEDDIGLRAEVLNRILETIPEKDVIALLPETSTGLRSLKSMHLETVAKYLTNWQNTKPSRLRHLVFQLTPSQLDVVKEALAEVFPSVTNNHDNPNIRGNALFLLCKAYLKSRSME
jgi:ParB family chromosome partitioning protein